MYVTYILQSEKDGRRYIGYTTHILKRLSDHNAGLNPSTRQRRPLRLLCLREFPTKREAIRYERYLKSLKGGKQLAYEIEKMKCDAHVAQVVPRTMRGMVRRGFVV